MAAFAAMACIRMLGAEEIARSMLRSQLVLAGEYDARWSLQSMLAAALGIAVVALFAAFLWRKLRQRQTGRTRLLLVAQLALLGFVPLVAMRVLSWHQLDRLLYAGPVRLNWLLELALALLPTIMAALYIRRVRLRGTYPPGRRPAQAPHDRPQ